MHNTYRIGSAIVVTVQRSSVVFSELIFNPQCFLLHEDTNLPPSHWDDVSLLLSKDGYHASLPQTAVSACLVASNPAVPAFFRLQEEKEEICFFLQAVVVFFDCRKKKKNLQAKKAWTTGFEATYLVLISVVAPGVDQTCWELCTECVYSYNYDVISKAYV